jgi:hypothetical protein
MRVRLRFYSILSFVLMCGLVFQSAAACQNVMDKEKYLQYVSEFNKGEDFEKVVLTYYTPDVVLDMATVRLEGRDKVLKFFIDVHKSMKETLKIESLLVDGGKIAAQILGEFYFTEDTDWRGKPMKKGDILYNKWFIFYDTRDGKISQIKLCTRSVEFKGARL